MYINGHSKATKHKTDNVESPNELSRTQEYVEDFIRVWNRMGNRTRNIRAQI